MNDVSIEIEAIDEAATLLRVAGPLNAMTFEQLDEAIQGQFDRKIYTLVLDISGVTQISSAGAGVLIAANEIAGKSNGGIALINITDEIGEILRMLGLLGNGESSLLPSAANVTDALTLLRS